MYVWPAISISLIALLLLDIGITRRTPQFSVRDALLQSAFWICLGLAFGIFIYLAYQYPIFSNLWPGETVLSGEAALSQYFSVYFIQRILNFDNLFIILILFQALKTPIQHQYRILFYGMIIAILVRILFILVGVELLDYFPWLHYFITALLLLSAIRLIANFTTPLQDKHRQLAKTLTDKLPVKTHPSKRFFFKLNGRFYVTPLLVSLLCIEYTDLIFSLDAIPAALTVSKDTFILLSASVFALLGLRALYFVFAYALLQLRYIKFALLAIILLLALRSGLLEVYLINTSVLLLIISGIIIISIIFSLRHQERSEITDLPFIDSFNRIYKFTYIGFRRLIVTLVGVSVIIIGIIMIVTPGPAIIVIPAGIAILATEFIWARLLLKKVKQKLLYFSKESKAFFKRKGKDR